MTWSIAIDVALVVLLLALGLFTIVVRDAFAAVSGFTAYGLLVAVAWVRLHAVDVALTEAAIGSGLSGVLMLGAAAKLRGAKQAAQPSAPHVSLKIAAAILSALVTVALAACVWLFPEPAPTLAPKAIAGLDATGVENPVTAVLMAYRATDTLLEKVVLVLAVIGVWSLAPDGVWGGRPGSLYRTDPDGVLPFFARVLPPFGIVVAVYILWVSAVEPGGAFAGGTILAAMWVLVMMAGLADAPPVSLASLRIAVLVGPAIFVTIGLAGSLIAGAFLAYPVDYAKALILTIEIPMTLSIAAMLGMLIAGSPQRVAQP